MRIGIWSQLGLILTIYRQISKMPGCVALRTLINPVDITRYAEFIHLLRFLKTENRKEMEVLDVSSPYILAYLLSSANRVVKSDINVNERVFVKESSALKFSQQNALSLSFSDASYDLVYSISVIEHIYQEYKQAISELVRVTRVGGVIYLTFPVARSHKEEWLDEIIYSDQFHRNGKTFFQYRFDERDINDILSELEGVEILDKSIYWERRSGTYDKAVTCLKYDLKYKYLNYLKDAALNLYCGFTLFDRTSTTLFEDKDFGNMSIIMRKC